MTDEKPAQEPAELSDDEFYVSVYIPDIKVMRAYKILWESVPRHANWRWW